MPEAKILIVEDEAIEAMDIQQCLVSFGYPLPDIAYTGEEGVRKVAETQPDLVLMDIMMPEKIDGVAAAEQIRSRFDIPIIFLTAYADEDTLRRAKITAPYGYIVKPFQNRELHIAVDIALYRHRMERELREREKWLATTLRSIGDAVIATDEKGLITFINPIAEGLMGCKLEEVQQRNLTEVFNIVNRDTRKPVENPVTRVMLEGNIVGLANHTVLISRDGKEIPINDSAAPIKDDHGNILGVILVFSDITEREKLAEALDKAYDELEARVEERTKELKDAERSLQKVNETLEQRVAERTAELQAANASLLNSRRATLNLMEDALAARKRAEEANAELLQEVAERKKAEADVLNLSEDMAARNMELEAVNRELEAFIYSVSHDLRAPLRSISSFAEFLVEDCADRLDSQGRDYVARINKGATRMSRLIEDLLYLSRISRQDINRTKLDLNKLALSIISELRESDTSRNVDVNIAGNIIAFADPRLMEIALSNLLGNAWKFTLKTKDARIEFGEEENPPLHHSREGTVYYVKDNGAGFDPEYAEKMFLPFHRLHSREEFEGMGIGLTIVERIVHRHGGKIWAVGETGKGATVYFTLG